MALTPADIDAQVFREKFKGYDQDQVDAFLDRLSSELAEMLRERDELVERMNSIEADAAESIEAERLLKRTLVTAQRTADETVAEAVAQGNAVVAEADERAASIVAAAEARAAQMLADAERNAAQTVATARSDAEAHRAAVEDELRQAREAVADLQRFRVEYGDRVRAAVAEQLAVLDGLAGIPEVPTAVARMVDGTEPGDAGSDAGGV